MGRTGQVMPSQSAAVAAVKSLKARVAVVQLGQLEVRARHTPGLEIGELDTASPPLHLGPASLSGPGYRPAEVLRPPCEMMEPFEPGRKNSRYALGASFSCWINSICSDPVLLKAIESTRRLTASRSRTT